MLAESSNFLRGNAAARAEFISVFRADCYLFSGSDRELAKPLEKTTKTPKSLKHREKYLENRGNKPNAYQLQKPKAFCKRAPAAFYLPGIPKDLNIQIIGSGQPIQDKAKNNTAPAAIKNAEGIALSRGASKNLSTNKAPAPFLKEEKRKEEEPRTEILAAPSNGGKEAGVRTLIKCPPGKTVRIIPRSTKYRTSHKVRDRSRA